MSDWSGADIDLVKKVIHDAELQLSSMVQIATSADQRATALTGIFIASATAISGVLIALVSKSVLDWSLISAGGVAAFLFLVGALLCISAAMPVAFWTPGMDPKAWEDPLNASKKRDEVLWQQIGEYRKKIETNRTTIARNAKRFKFGAMCGIAAPFVGLTTFALAQSCGH